MTSIGRQAEFPWRSITGVFSSLFGRERPSDLGEVRRSQGLGGVHADANFGLSHGLFVDIELLT